MGEKRQGGRAIEESAEHMHLHTHEGHVPTFKDGLGRSARDFTVLSIIAAIATIGLKLLAYALTGSIGLLSDAAESLTNLLAALVAFWMLTIAERPPDEEHAYGHTKAEYFSSGLESALILIAAGGIAWAAIDRLMHPRQLENVGLGVLASMAATAINGGVALVLLSTGKRLSSITLIAGAHHLLTDVWTSLGVVAAVLLVQLTGWWVLDPLIALAVAANIAWIGIRLMSASAHGLLDTALPPADRETITRVLEPYKALGIRFHALRTRMAGQRRFISMHVLVPGSWSVMRGHNLCEQIERDLISALPKTTVFTHLEPIEDPLSWADQGLDRQMAEQAPHQPAGDRQEPSP
jgi:cation diffusion facilitator family transporter